MDELLGGEPIWILVLMTKQHGTTMTRIARCTPALNRDPSKIFASYQVSFFDHPAKLLCYWVNVFHGEDTMTVIPRDIAEHMTYKMSSDRNDWTVAAEVIDEDDAIQCRIELEVA